MASNPVGARFTYSLRLSEPSHIRVSLFDASGGIIQALLDEKREAGIHSLDVSLPPRVPQGIYFLRADNGTEVVDRKVTILGPGR